MVFHFFLGTSHLKNSTWKLVMMERMTYLSSIACPQKSPCQVFGSQGQKRQEGLSAAVALIKVNASGVSAAPRASSSKMLSIATSLGFCAFISCFLRFVTKEEWA